MYKQGGVVVIVVQLFMLLVYLAKHRNWDVAATLWQYCFQLLIM